MANPFINSSFTLRPSTNDRDKPELTLRRTEVSRIPMQTAVSSDCMRGGRAFKRQRLFIDRSLSTTLGRDHGDDDNYCGNGDQYISEDEYDTPIIHRRVSNELYSRRRISGGSFVSESNYWKSRCISMQNFCDDSQHRLREAEEDQRQLRQRIRELEEQLLLQTSRNSNANAIYKYKSDTKKDETFADRRKNANQDNEKGETSLGCRGKSDKEINNNSTKKAPPTLVVEIKDNHKAVSKCFYLTDGEGLNESYELEMEEEDISMDDHFCDGMLNDIDDDRNDINMNQRRG